MKKLYSLAFALLFSANYAQVQNPVNWSARYEPKSASEGEIVISAMIEKGWHTYSQKVSADGPVPTSFSFQPSPAYELVGATAESEAHEEYVPAFEAKIFIYSEKAEFRQKVKVKKPGQPVSFHVEFMSCNDMMCLPPKTVPLSVKLQ